MRFGGIIMGKKRFNSNSSNPFYYSSETKHIENTDSKYINIRAYNNLLEIINEKNDIINNLVFQYEKLIYNTNETLFWNNFWTIFGIIASNVIVALLSWSILSGKVIG